MKKLIIILFSLLSINAFGQKDSTQIWIIDAYPGDMTCLVMHPPGTVCGPDTIIAHWSYKRKTWSIISDSLYDVLYNERNGRYRDVRSMAEPRSIRGGKGGDAKTGTVIFQNWQ